MRKKMKILILVAAATIATSLALPAAADAYYYGYGYPYYGSVKLAQPRAPRIGARFANLTEPLKSLGSGPLRVEIRSFG